VEGSHKLFSLNQLIDFEAERRAVDIAMADTKTDLDPGSVAYATWRKTMAQAVKFERENEVAMGELVPIDFMLYCLPRVANEMVGIMDSLPLNIARRHPEVLTRALDTIKKEVAKSLNALATIHETALPGIIDEYMEQYG